MQAYFISFEFTKSIYLVYFTAVYDFPHYIFLVHVLQKHLRRVQKGKANQKQLLSHYTYIAPYLYRCITNIFDISEGQELAN